MRAILLTAAAALIVGVVAALLIPQSRRPPGVVEAVETTRAAPGEWRGSPPIAGRKGPPALRPVRTSSADIATDPSEVDYDPVKAAAMVGGNRNLFPREPRDPAWAGAVENALLPMIQDDLSRLVPGVSNAKMECRSTMCKISWDGPREVEVKARKVLSILFGGASESFPSDNDMLIVYAGGPFFSGLKGKSGELIDKITTARRARIDDLASGRAPGHYYKILPEEAWKK